jgi:hypothetical protein
LAVITNGDALYVYQNAQGIPTEYVDSDLYFASSVAYDDAGNIFINGTYKSQQFALIELPYGTSDFQDINVPNGNYLNAAWFEPILWDGKYLDLGSVSSSNSRRDYTLVNRLQISGSNATIVGTLPLANQKGAEYPQFWIEGSTIVQPSNKPRSFFQSFKYPGGKSIGRVKLGGQYDLWGAVVSVAPKN